MSLPSLVINTSLAFINASIASLWHLEPVLDEVTIEHPVVAVQLRADGSLLNRATVGKWGIRVGRVELVLRKVSA